MTRNLRRQLPLFLRSGCNGGKLQCRQKDQNFSNEAKWLQVGVLGIKILRRNRYLLAGIAHNLVRFAFRHDTNAVVLTGKYNLKTAFG